MFNFVRPQFSISFKKNSRFAKKIYILAPHPLYPLNFMNKYLDTVTQKPAELESLHLKKIDVDEDWRTARERFSRIKCTKCKVWVQISANFQQFSPTNSRFSTSVSCFSTATCTWHSTGLQNYHTWIITYIWRVPQWQSVIKCSRRLLRKFWRLFDSFFHC